jgi:hypothetical protein
MRNKILDWASRNSKFLAEFCTMIIVFVMGALTVLVLDFVHPLASADPPAEYEVHVFDVREAMAQNGIPEGWAPMLRDFLEKHPELEYVDSGIAHTSGGAGTVNAMFVVTKKK